MTSSYFFTLKNYSMLQIKSKSIAVKPLVLAALCATLFSFSGKMGTDSFEIRLNNKPVIQQYVTQKAAVKSLQLDQSVYNEQIDVYYSHCGQIGKDGSITIKDGQNKILKEWNFSDAV